MTEPLTTNQALALVQEIEKSLLQWNSRLLVQLTFEDYEKYDRRSQADNVECCLSLVQGQIQEAWIHAGRAIKRLEKMRQLEWEHTMKLAAQEEE